MKPSFKEPWMTESDAIALYGVMEAFKERAQLRQELATLRATCTEQVALDAILAERHRILEILRQQDQIIDPRPTLKKLIGLIEKP